MQRTFYWQHPNQMGGRPNEPRVWFPDDCSEIVLDVDPSEDPADMLESAAEAICVAEYRRLMNRFASQQMHHDDELIVFVSASRDEPGTMFEVTLVLDPSAVAYRRQSRRPIRLPDAAELAEAAA